MINLSKIRYDSTEVLENTETEVFEGQIRFDAKQPKINHLGWLMVDAYIARVGVIDMTDIKPGHREFIPEDALFNQDSLDTLPALDIEQIHKSGRQDGVVWGTPRKEITDKGTFLVVPLAIKDKYVIQDVLTHKTSEVSPEYLVNAVRQDGIFNGESYNHIQRQRVYTKIALVKNGTARGGRHVKIRLDSTDVDPKYLNYKEEPKQAENKIDDQNLKEKKVTMIIDGLNVDVKENEEKIVDKAIKDREAKIQAKEADLVAAGSRFDSLQAQFDEAQEKIKRFDSTDKLAEAREIIKLENSVKPILGESFRFDSLSPAEIKKQALQKLKPEIDLAGKSDDYISARFDSVMENETVNYDANDSAFDRSRQIASGAKGEAGQSEAGKVAKSLFARIAGKKE
jgi:hypothetical protein